MNATLTMCPDCRHEISPRAATCPNCGAPRKQISRGNIAAAYGLALLIPPLGFIAGLYLLCFKHEPGHGIMCIILSVLSAWLLWQIF